MTNSFWTGGPAAYARGVKEHYQEKNTELHARLKDCRDDTKRKEIEQEIAAAKAELKDKLGGSDSLIF